MKRCSISFFAKFLDILIFKIAFIVLYKVKDAVCCINLQGGKDSIVNTILGSGNPGTISIDGAAVVAKVGEYNP